MPKNKRNRHPSLTARIKKMAALGYSHALIAKRVGLPLAQLESQFSSELQTASLEMDAFVGGSLFQKAVAGDVTAQIFWLKTRAGWSETIRREISGAQGGPIAIQAVNAAVKVVMPCNKHNECPRKSPERSIKILEKILQELKNRKRKTLPG